MGALDRDYWKEPKKTKDNPTINNIQPNKKNNDKFKIIISEYNKNVPFLNRYIKISDLLLWTVIGFIIIIFVLIFLTT